MALFKLLLKGFEFPADLPARNSNFRLVFQLRHFDATSETWVTTESVSPGLSTYWECDASKNKGGGLAKYVRDGAHPRFRPLSPWDQVVLLASSSELFQLRVVVYDVDRADWVDLLRNLGDGLLGALVGAAKAQLPAPVGTILEKVREAVVDMLAREDTMLFSLIYEFGSDQSSQPIDLPYGGYTLRLELLTTGQRPSTARDAGAALTTGRIDLDNAFSQVPRASGAASKSKSAAKRTASRPAARRKK